MGSYAQIYVDVEGRLMARKNRAEAADLETKPGNVLHIPADFKLTEIDPPGAMVVRRGKADFLECGRYAQSYCFGPRAGYVL